MKTLGVLATYNHHTLLDRVLPPRDQLWDVLTEGINPYAQNKNSKWVTTGKANKSGIIGGNSTGLMIVQWDVTGKASRCGIIGGISTGLMAVNRLRCIKVISTSITIDEREAIIRTEVLHRSVGTAEVDTGKAIKRGIISGNITGLKIMNKLRRSGVVSASVTKICVSIK